MRDGDAIALPWARAWHGFVALVIAAALITQLVLSATGEDYTAPFRITNLFSFFTIQSNILLAVISITLALRPDRRTGQFWRVVRLDSLICMTVTGLVFVTVLRGTEELEGLRAVTDVAFHYFAPVAAVVGWLAFGPRPQIDWRSIGLALVFPIAWCVYTLVRGAITDWYPYPFIDVTEHGYGTVIVNSILVAALFVVISALFRLADQRLPAAPRVSVPADR